MTSDEGSTMTPDAPPCHACGYDLRGITSDRCPECGELILVAILIHSHPANLRRAVRVLADGEVPGLLPAEAPFLMKSLPRVHAPKVLDRLRLGGVIFAIETWNDSCRCPRCRRNLEVVTWTRDACPHCGQVLCHFPAGLPTNEPSPLLNYLRFWWVHLFACKPIVYPLLVAGIVMAAIMVPPLVDANLRLVISVLLLAPAGLMVLAGAVLCFNSLRGQRMRRSGSHDENETDDQRSANPTKR